MPAAPTLPRYLYPGLAGGAAAVHRLYAPRPAATGVAPRWFGHAADRGDLSWLHLEDGTLRVAPFQIERWGQRFASPAEIAIALSTLGATRYRIVAVHNFRVEDRNPDLDTCPAAIFLAQQVDGRWEEAEDHPVECRSVAVLGHLEVAARRIILP